MNDLNPPTMAAVVDGQLDPSKIPSTGAPVVMNIPGTYAGERLTLTLEPQPAGTPLYTSPSLPIGASGRPVTLRIPRQHFLEHLGAPLQVRYSLSSAGSSPSLTFGVEQGFTGEQHVDLSKHHYQPLYVNGEVSLPRTPPAFVFHERSAPGATAYRSSDESIATVDGQGKVTLLRNGQSTITAELPGGPQSYVLSVSGILGFEVLSSRAVTFQKAESECLSNQMRLPQFNELLQLVDQYGAELLQVLSVRAPFWGAATGAGSAAILKLSPRPLVTSEVIANGELRQVMGIG